MILDQFGRAITPSKKPESRQLTVAPLIDSMREYVTSGITPERLASILKDADSGDVTRQCELFDQIEEKDSHIIGERGKRINSITDIEFTINPMSEDSKDVKIAEFCSEWLSQFTEFNDVIISMQDAVGKGFACHEINWYDAVPESFNFIEQKRFIFHDREGYVLKYPLLLTDYNSIGEDIPAWKLMLHRYNGQTGHPTRAGIYRVCAWMWLFKNYAIKDWVSFCSIYGMPLRLGKYLPSAKEEDKAALLQAITALGSDAAGIISKSMEIEFVSGITSSTGGELYENLARFCNREISKAITGSSQSGDSESPGSYASDNVKNSIRLDLLKSDGNAIASTFRNQILRPIVGFNFGWDAKVPLMTAVWEEQADLKLLSETFNILNQMKVPLELSFIREKFGIPEPEKDAEFLPTAQPQDPFANQDIDNQDKEQIDKNQDKEVKEPEKDDGEEKKEIPKKAKAENVPRRTLKNKSAAKRLANDVDPLMQAAINRVKAYVSKAKSLEEIRDGVFNLFPEMNSTDIGQIMTQALIAAELNGVDEG